MDTIGKMNIIIVDQPFRYEEAGVTSPGRTKEEGDDRCAKINKEIIQTEGR